MLRGFFVGCAQKHLSAPIYFLTCAETFHVARIYLLSAQRNIRCADLFYKCAETFQCDGLRSIMLLGLKVGDDQRLSLIFSGDQV